MLLGISLALHVLAIVIWVGGMFFAYMILRPAAVNQLEPPPRLKLWREVFTRFFPWVWVAVIVAPLTGVYLTMLYGGFATAPLHVTLMTWLGSLMIVIFLFVFFSPFRLIKQCLDKEDFPAAAQQLNRIRFLVGTNTILGLLTIAVATAGKFMLV